MKFIAVGTDAIAKNQGRNLILIFSLLKMFNLFPIMIGQNMQTQLQIQEYLQLNQKRFNLENQLLCRFGLIAIWLVIGQLDFGQKNLSIIVKCIPVIAIVVMN